MPERIQRSRKRGWRMPDGAVYVGRPSKWGNPWALHKVTHPEFGDCYQIRHTDGRIFGHPDGTPGHWSHKNAIWWAARLYGETVVWPDPEMQAAIRAELAGKTLACWCPESQPCHGDTLLEIANG